MFTLEITHHRTGHSVPVPGEFIERVESGERTITVHLGSGMCVVLAHPDPTFAAQHIRDRLRDDRSEWIVGLPLSATMAVKTTWAQFLHLN